MNVLNAAKWAVLEPQIDELLTLPPIERARRLDELAANDPASADQLRALLRSRDAASEMGFLASPAAPGLVPVGPTGGDTFGAWTLVDLLGEGGMGTVWRARRNDGRFEGEAAVKLLKSGLFDALSKERFRREGAILAQLRQPGIAQLLDAGVTPQGQPYMVLELVHGERIDRWCEVGALSVRQRVELFTQVVDAAAAAHGHLVIHRDLKPSNILIDRDGRAKLVDFGIARMLSDEEGALAPAVTQLTQEGSFALTPAYAAPEQFQRGLLSTATDVYALGVVLYELLVGAHPSGLPPGSAPLAYLQAAVEQRVQLASAAAPQRRRELRGDLDTILAKACAADPRNRYASAAALRDDLQRHLGNEPIVARPASAWYRLNKLIRRHPLESATAALVMLAVPAGAHVQAAVLLSLGIGTGLALWQMRRAQRQAELAHSEQRRAEAVKQFIASTFGQAVPREGTGGIVTAGDLLHSAHARVQAELRDHSPVAAELLAIVGDSFHELGDVAAALQVLPDAVERCEATFGRAHPITLHARTGLAQARVVLGELEAAERMLPGLLADLRAAMPGSAADLAGALSQHSYALTKRGDAQGAIHALQDALAVAREHCGPSHRITLSTAGLLGNTLATFGRDGDALAVLEPAVADARQAHGAKRPHTELARLESLLAGSMISSGRLCEAEALLRQVLRDQWLLDGRDTNRNRYTRNMLAVVLAARGDFAAGIEQMREALAADRRIAEKATVDTGTMTSQLGGMLVEAGHFDEGMAELDRAEVLIRAAGGSGQRHPSLRRAARRAHCLLLAGRASEALAAALSVLHQAADCEGSNLAIASRVRIGALLSLGRLSEVDLHLPEMAELAARHANPGNCARADLEIARSHLAQSRGAEGLAFARRAVQALAPTQIPESALLQSARNLVAACERRAGAAARGLGVGRPEGRL